MARMTHLLLLQSLQTLFSKWHARMNRSCHLDNTKGSTVVFLSKFVVGVNSEESASLSAASRLTPLFPFCFFYHRLLLFVLDRTPGERRHTRGQHCYYYWYQLSSSSLSLTAHTGRIVHRGSSLCCILIHVPNIIFKIFVIDSRKEKTFPP